MTPPSGKPQASFEDPLSLVSRALTKLYTLWLSATYPFASRGRSLSIQYPCIVSQRSLIAVVIPTYNRVRSVPVAISGVLHQTYANL
jgi:hypothetical protein